MRPSTPRGEQRFRLTVLAAVSLVVIALVSVLLTHLRSEEQGASAHQYAQVTQAPQTVAVQTVAFIGDSYSAGTGSSGYSSRFTTLVAAYEGWVSESFAYGGTGYLRETPRNGRTGCGQDYCPNYDSVISKVRAFDPTIVFVSGGRNDVGLPEPQVEAAISKFFNDLRTALPDAKIIVTSPLWAYESPPAQLTAIQRAVQHSVASVGGTYLDIGEPLVTDRALVASDNVHPNDRGHAAIAQAMEVALSAAERAATPTSTPSTSATSP